MPELLITPTFEAAMSAVRDGRNLFITGRAGTGKSTLLSLIRDLDLGRACAVVAPTGVAALNVEGETIHSFFGFRPSLGPQLLEYRAPNHLNDIDLLIVDEVSMARADLIDMMDTALRRRRQSDEPFGGLQMVLVGDLFQLPPVVTQADAESILIDYSSPFFFAANALARLTYETLELEHVFRQRDERFISLLNAIRDGTASDDDLDALNARVDAERAEDPGVGAITLTTTNRAADAVNRAMLDRLPGPVLTSKAGISGGFDPAQYKAEVNLSYAVGAQVMMLVNSPEYVNGSLGRIVEAVDDRDSPQVIVELAETGQTIRVRRHRWEITRPVRRDGYVTQEVVGSFTQLPFRLAWAVTVHKSQGKTFDDVVFDRGRSTFAAGQLYVALSRCTSLDGLVLKRPLRRRDVITDSDVKRFHLRARTVPVPQNRTLHSFVGYVGTGGGEFNKLAELAVIREVEGGGPVHFTTLVNPLRDISDAAETGIGAADVAIAPTVAELRPVLATLLADTVLVTQNLSELSRLLDWGADGISDGLGIDLREHGLWTAASGESTALDHAQTNKRAADGLKRAVIATAPIVRAASVPGSTPYLLPRRGHDNLYDLISFIVGLAAPAEDRLRLLLGLAPGAQGAEGELCRQARGFAQMNRVSDTLWRTATNDLVEHLVVAASRNATFTTHETEVIKRVAGMFRVQYDEERLSHDAARIELRPGLRVCFTGAPPSGPEFAHLTKPNLRAAAAAVGLEETPSVTKTKCDLVVAFDPSSMSGKAKKARDLGKPLLGAVDFLAFVADLPRLDTRDPGATVSQPTPPL